MERTKKPQEGFFSDSQLKRTKQGMQSSVDTFSANINNFMIPKLREAGYDGRLVRSDVVLKCLQKKENFSTINPRYLLHDEGKGWWLEIWPKENRNHKMVVKPTVIESTKPNYLKNHPRFNLPLNFLKRISMYHKNIWIRTIWEKFFALDLMFLIMTKTGMFWMGIYSDISAGQTISGKKGVTHKECGWELTYRNDPTHPDRIAIKPDFQVGKFRSMTKQIEGMKEFSGTQLQGALMTQIYYWTKNNNYESK